MLGVATACAMLLASCSAGQETVTPTSGTAMPSTPLAIPSVSDPLDASEYVRKPCGLLDDSQRAELALAGAERSREGVYCELSPAKPAKYAVDFLRVGVWTASLDQQLQFECSVSCENWSLGSLDGYPAIWVRGQLGQAYCTLLLGIADDTTVNISDMQDSGLSDTENDCGRAERAARLVLETLRK